MVDELGDLSLCGNGSSGGHSVVVTTGRLVEDPELVEDNPGLLVLDAVLLPVVSLEAPVYVGEPALCQDFLGSERSLAPDDALVEFGLVDALTFLVPVDAVRGDAEGSHLPSVVQLS